MSPLLDMQSLQLVSFAELVLEIVPRFQPFEFMRPAQLDQYGTSNNMLVRRPSGGVLRLPGCGGIADATSVNGNLICYLPRHDRRTLVPKVQFASGAARPALHDRLPRVPRCAVTELCVLTFDDQGAIVESVHPGVDRGELAAATDFVLRGLVEAPFTEPPDDSELEALREYDSDRLRDLEFLSGPHRAQRLRVRYEREVERGSA